MPGRETSRGAFRNPFTPIEGERHSDRFERSAERTMNAKILCCAAAFAAGFGLAARLDGDHCP